MMSFELFKLLKFVKDVHFIRILYFFSLEIYVTSYIN